MTNRREFSSKTKVAAFKRDKGRCQECSKDLRPGDVFYDHIIADATGGEPTLDNCQCLCRTCHDLKTALHDVPAAAKVKRQAAKSINATAPKQPINSPGFAASGRRQKHPIPLPPRTGGIRMVERG